MKARLLWMALLLVGCNIYGPMQVERGVVENISYTPGHTVTGVGPAMGGRGGIAVTTASIPESWVTFIRFRGENIPVEDEDLTRSVRLGDTVNVEYSDILTRDSTPTGEYHLWGVKRRPRGR